MFSLYEFIDLVVNYSSKLEKSSSELKIGTNGALIDLFESAFQLTFSNHGWALIYPDPFFPILVFGSFYSNKETKLWSFGETFGASTGLYNIS